MTVQLIFIRRGSDHKYKAARALDCLYCRNQNMLIYQENQFSPTNRIFTPCCIATYFRLQEGDS